MLEKLKIRIVNARKAPNTAPKQGSTGLLSVVCKAETTANCNKAEQSQMMDTDFAAHAEVAAANLNFMAGFCSMEEHVDYVDPNRLTPLINEECAFQNQLLLQQQQVYFQYANHGLVTPAAQKTSDNNGRACTFNFTDTPSHAHMQQEPPTIPLIEAPKRRPKMRKRKLLPKANEMKEKKALVSLPPSPACAPTNTICCNFMPTNDSTNKSNSADSSEDFGDDFGSFFESEFDEKTKHENRNFITQESKDKVIELQTALHHSSERNDAMHKMLIKTLDELEKWRHLAESLRNQTSPFTATVPNGIPYTVCGN